MDKEKLSNLHRLVSDHRTVALLGPINAESMERLSEDLLACQMRSAHEPIKLIIMSGGGQVNSALMLCDLMNHVITAPVHALVVGMCASAATFILLNCPVRRATPHARFVIHSGSMSGLQLKMDQMTEKNLNDLLLETKKITTIVDALYREKLGVTSEQVIALRARGDQDFNQYLNAEEALELGLITEIVSGKVEIFSKVRS